MVNVVQHKSHSIQRMKTRQWYQTQHAVNNTIQCNIRLVRLDRMQAIQ